MSTFSRGVISAGLAIIALLGAAPAGRGEGDLERRANPVISDEEFLSALNLDYPGMEKVRQAVAEHRLPDAQAAYLEYRRTACPTHWKVVPADRPAAATAKDDPAGDAVLLHRLHKDQGFTFKDVDMGREFNWMYNPVPDSDPNHTPEWTYWVARTEFWDVLATAYWKTQDEKYAAGWVGQLEDFARKNPLREHPASGKPSFWRTLDSAIRVANSWPNAYAHFLLSPKFTPEVNWLYAKLNYEHALLLRDSLSKPDNHGNWIVTQSKGLYTIGLLFPELREGATWKQTALDRLVTEVQWSVFPDGFEKELTPNYHFVVASALTSALELATLNQQEVPEKLRLGIQAMYRAPVLVMDQSGNDVATNDSHTDNAAKQARNGLKLGDDPLLRWAASGGAEGTAPPDSTALPYAGFYAMRGGWKPNDFFLFFRGGPTGIGHEHEDMLEVVLRAWNKTFLFDPGNYSYDQSEWRRFATGTAAHNTIIVDGNWQHRGASSGSDVPQPTGNPWATTPLFDYVAAAYSGGYQKSVYKQQIYHPQEWIGEPDRSVSHTRRVVFLRPYCALLLDTLDGSGRHVFDAHFHLDAPAAKLDRVSQTVVSENPSGEPQLALFALERENLQTEIIQGQKEPLLGWFPTDHRPIPTVRFRKEQAAPAIFATVLYPYLGDEPTLVAKALPCDLPGVWSRTLTTPKETAELALQLAVGKAGTVSFRSGLLGTNVRAEAALVLIRRASAGGPAYVGADQLTEYRDNNVSFVLDKPRPVVFARQEDGLLVYNGDEDPAVLKAEQPFTGAATLPPHVWTLVSASGAKPAPAPALLP